LLLSNSGEISVCIIMSNSVLLSGLATILWETLYESIIISSAKIANFPETLDLNTLYPELTALL
jgi:hypothetical protein